MNVIDRIEKCMNSLERAKREYENGDKRLSKGSLDYALDYCKASIYLLLNEIEDDEALKGHHKQEVRESYNKAIKLNGEALKRLKDN